MNNTDSVRLSEPYMKKSGRTTFLVSSFGNSKGTETAQQLLVRLMENRVTKNNLTFDKEDKSA